MVRISKKPEIRRQELIEAARNLFITKGYEATSIKDILAVVGGQPGMFYHYFKSKEEIYSFALNQFADEYVKETKVMLAQKDIPIPIRICNALDFCKTSLSQFIIATNSGHLPESSNMNIVISMKILNMLVAPMSALILEGKESGLINSSLAEAENVSQLSLFILYGITGSINDNRNSILTMEIVEENMRNVIPLISKVLDISIEKMNI